MPIGALDQPLFSADALGWDFPAGSFCEDFHCESSMRSHRPFHLSCLWVILRSCGWTILLQSLCLTRIYLFHVSFDGWLVCFHVSILVAFIFFYQDDDFPNACRRSGVSVIPFPLPGKLFCILQFYSNAPVGRNIVMQAMCSVCCLLVTLFCICCSKCR